MATGVGTTEVRTRRAVSGVEVVVVSFKVRLSRLKSFGLTSAVSIIVVLMVAIMEEAGAVFIQVVPVAVIVDIVFVSLRIYTVVTHSEVMKIQIIKN